MYKLIELVSNLNKQKIKQNNQIAIHKVFKILITHLVRIYDLTFFIGPGQYEAPIVGFLGI